MTTTTNYRPQWLSVALLIVLSLAPAAAGGARLHELATSDVVTEANMRFFVSPEPVIIHIIASMLFLIVGAFQFTPSFRSGRRIHRWLGRVVAPAGLASALSGLWMTQFYELPPHDGVLLYIVRWAVGVGMAASIILGVIAAMNRDIQRHRAWMMRGYALGLGAGTQVVVFLPFLTTVGMPDTVLRGLLMSAGWGLNLLVAEYHIRKPFRRSSSLLLATSD